jgi:signal transduction histidine kinase
MFSEQIAERLNVLVNVAAAAIANAQLLKNTRQALNEINSLYIISREMVTLDVNFLLTNAVELLQENFGYYQVLIYMHDPVSGDLVLRYASGSVGQALLEQKHRLPAGTGIVGYIYDTGAPFFTHNVEEVAFFIRNPLLPETRSEMGVPLKIAGYTLGVIDIQQAAPHSLTARDLRLVSSVADQLSVNLYNANLYEDLQSVLQNEQTMRSQLIQSERLAIVGRLLASISHELNNPLQAIHNILFLLKRDEKFSAQGKQDLEIIISEIERMTSLIGRLRATYQPQLDEIRDIELHNIIEDVYVLTATYMRHRNIAFEFCPDENLPVLAGIPGQLRQVLLNLFLNAIDAMPGGGELMVQTQNLPEEKQILLTVSDTGVGISPDIMPHLFEPFITDKDTGTGLGMTITRDIILQHHGNIQATNNPTGGAVFKIWLPAPSTD